jgi:hypothetical protein
MNPSTFITLSKLNSEQAFSIKDVADYVSLERYHNELSANTALSLQKADLFYFYAAIFYLVLLLSPKLAITTPFFEFNLGTDLLSSAISFFIASIIYGYAISYQISGFQLNEIVNRINMELLNDEASQMKLSVINSKSGLLMFWFSNLRLNIKFFKSLSPFGYMYLGVVLIFAFSMYLFLLLAPALISLSEVPLIQTVRTEPWGWYTCLVILFQFCAVFGPALYFGMLAFYFIVPSVRASALK